ncbi:MAG: flavin reductase [Alphaproteobacteria bacterium]|nr:MAG: flavin reductase [Alphaproteobacteria bacterium]
MERFTLGQAQQSGCPDEPEHRRLRRALGRWPTGVAIATCGRVGEQMAGLTINSFASVSLDPPLVLWSLARTASVAPAFKAAPFFAINVLEAGQEALARRFAEREDRFAGLPLERGLEDLPLIPEAIAVFECRRTAVHPGGDHWILLGEVMRVTTRPGRALAFHEGMFRELP